MSSPADYFDALYARSDDPWALSKRWYERRKRQLTTAILPRERYRNVFEPGCANGELTALLASRCDALLAADLHERAVRATRRRLAPCPHVRVEQRVMPRDWPRADAPFDLIVVSELAYYLDTQDLYALAASIVDTLSDDGVLLACHWRRPFAEALHSATDIHAVFDTHCGLTCVAHHVEEDLLLDVWSRDGRSVAQCEEGDA